MALMGALDAAARSVTITLVHETREDNRQVTLNAGGGRSHVRSANTSQTSPSTGSYDDSERPNGKLSFGRCSKYLF
jgi:hypothetical protein